MSRKGNGNEALGDLTPEQLLVPDSRLLHRFLTKILLAEGRFDDESFKAWFDLARGEEGFVDSNFSSHHVDYRATKRRYAAEDRVLSAQEAAHAELLRIGRAIIGVTVRDRTTRVERVNYVISPVTGLAPKNVGLVLAQALDGTESPDSFFTLRMGEDGLITRVREPSEAPELAELIISKG